MPAVDVYGDFVVDPDTLKVPENPEHRRVAELIAVVAELLDPTVAVYRDMNWYPRDGGNAIAPDVMTLPPGALPHRAKSYRQPVGGPVPAVAVEVISETDSVSGFLGKTIRYRRLGVPVYVVTVDDGVPGVLRLAPDSSDHLDWTGRPIPELGGLRITVDDGTVVVTTPDGMMLRSPSGVALIGTERVRIADARADAAERRAEALAEKLRALGVDPVD